MHRAQFFLARGCEKDVQLALRKSLWTTDPFVEKLLAEAFRRAPVVILIFLSKKADHFADRAVYAASDGCEIQRAAGQRLCCLFPFDDSVDLKALRRKAAQQPRKTSRNGVPSLLDSEISYREFQHAKRNLPVKKTLKELLHEDHPPQVLLSSRRHESRSRRSNAPPLMDVAVPRPVTASSFSSSSSLWRKRRCSPVRVSPKRRAVYREHRHRSRSSE
ncbi:unnamed protein product [Gongylonema pulchrum]|uniref:YTH domain-containing protein n=1 Tax=Gongylonema pulchrum TaxID=637853 RepID=A0A183E2U5_9BILA|nr:unnamed protein product [Gongylonema pulchrum]